MQAVRWHARRDIRVEQVPEPGAPPAGWVRLRVEVCGICGTDLEEYLAGPLVLPHDGPHPLTGAFPPMTLGHEIVGVVEESAAGGALRPGTRVAVDGNLFCGKCDWCRRGETTLCVTLAAIGQGCDGGLADYVLAPEYSCVPYEAEPEIAAFAEPLSVAVRAVRRGAVGIGARVGIIGAGTIGLLVTQVAKLAGAAEITVVEPHPQRRELAARLGADRVVESADLADQPDITFDAGGRPVTSTLAVRWVRRGGRAVLLSVFNGDTPVQMMDFLLGEKDVIASLSHTYNDDFPTAVRLLERGDITVRPLITDRLALADVVRLGFEALRTAPSEHLKVLAFPG
ncbi:MAG TPA: alcohol dehydrogenase catalytic domain-containing protein [Mycobacteriales bacterium]|jgi:(R,R)-butanediol dehydrogenase/meso-butanediol dehydrogenase/diacetyl reductase|nr:alcohol dehydrogenase catalytic domain-containing protein [Mycobacteriales bacterium]